MLAGPCLEVAGAGTTCCVTSLGQVATASYMSVIDASFTEFLDCGTDRYDLPCFVLGPPILSPDFDPQYYQTTLKPYIAHPEIIH